MLIDLQFRVNGWQANRPIDHYRIQGLSNADPKMLPMAILAHIIFTRKEHTTLRNALDPDLNRCANSISVTNAAFEPKFHPVIFIGFCSQNLSIIANTVGHQIRKTVTVKITDRGAE